MTTVRTDIMPKNQEAPSLLVELYSCMQKEGTFPGS